MFSRSWITILLDSSLYRHKCVYSLHVQQLKVCVGMRIAFS